MKKNYIIIGVIVVLLFGWVNWANNVYDKAIIEQETSIEMWANVESSYQRRADLIPNLVKVVKGYATHEKETLTAVIEARAKATSTTIDVGNMSAASMQKFQAAQNGLSSALSKLMVVVERYPDLKANQNFLELQAQLEGTENRINVARNKYNESVKTYNTHVRGKFRGMALSVFGEDGEFEKREPFNLVTKGAENAPEIDM